MNQEALIKASMLENQIKETEQHAEFISSQIAELKALEENILSLEESEETTLSSLGNGIYIKSKPEEKNLFVSIGAGIMVKKTSEETKKIIEKQISRLSSFEEQLSLQLQSGYAQLNEIIQIIESQKQQTI